MAAFAPQSVMGGRLVFERSFMAGSGTENITAAVHNPEMSLIVENPAGMAEQLVTTDGGALQITVTAANSLGLYSDSASIWLKRAGLLSNLEIFALVSCGAVQEQFAFLNCRSDAVAWGGADNNCLTFEPSRGDGLFNIQRSVSSVQTLLGGDPGAVAWTTGVWGLRCVMQANRYMARRWNTTTSGIVEPRSWDWTVEPTTETLFRGSLSFGMTGGNSGTVAFTENLVHLVVWDLDAAPEGALKIGGL